MEVVLTRGELHARAAGLAAVTVFEGRDGLAGAAAAADRATCGAVAAVLGSRDLTGRFLETALIYPRGIKAKRMLLVGLGRRADLTPHRVLQAAALAARRARELKAGSLAFGLPGATTRGLPAILLAQAAAEGAVLGHYQFSAYRTESPLPPLARTHIVEPNPSPEIAAAVARGARWAEATCLARDLASTPGQDLVPERLAARAREIAEASGASAKILRVPQLERLGLGALLGVGRGSANPPCLIVLERPAGGARPRGSRRAAETPTVVVVGKGITFDTGGISLKPRENMHRMKDDMSGGAAVLALFSALPSLDPPMRVVGLIPAAENMPGGRALKPGDVLRAMDGTTIEVTNTDAEGRLVLADALTYARSFSPEVVVDLATLTGAVSIALGRLAAGLFTDDDALANELLAAGEAAGERLWRLPLWDEYAADLKSETADLVNAAESREGGAILGAMFLKRFARSMRWAHLDIASTSWAIADRPHERRGPTGFGARLLLEWLSRRGAGGGA